MKARFLGPNRLKGESSTDTGHGYAYKAGDLVFEMSSLNDRPADGEPSEFIIQIIFSPTLAAAPASDGSYGETQNMSVIFGNSKVYYKVGSAGKTDGTWTEL